MLAFAVVGGGFCVVGGVFCVEAAGVSFSAIVERDWYPKRQLLRYQYQW